MEKFNQNKNFENEIRPNLPELEQRTVTPFRGMADYVQDMAELFNQERFEILVPLAPEDNIFYECSFADAKQAELYFENSCRAENVVCLEYGIAVCGKIIETTAQHAKTRFLACSWLGYKLMCWLVDSSAYNFNFLFIEMV